MRVLVLLACLVAAACAEKARFDNYVVYRVVPTTHDQLQALHQLQAFPDGLSFWTDANKVGAAVDIMVPPHKKPSFNEMMSRLNIDVQVFIANLQEKIDNEIPANAPKAMDWTSYHRVDEINAWLDELVAQYPEVEAIEAGVSFEGRTIRGVKVSFGADRLGLFVEGGMHAREWISPATVTYILNEVLTSTDPEFRALVESYDWYVFPSTNPDGYEYTHTDDRLWRKTRSDNGGLCIGADPNRNWGFYWGTGGSSSIPCSDTYMGTAAFSEPETKGLSDYINTIADKLDVFVGFHSYSQLILIPYGLDSPVIPDREQHDIIGANAAAALSERYGTQYTVGNIVELLYVSSGSSMDWVKGVHDIDVTLEFELRDEGQNGFVLPPDQIIPTGEETLDAVVSILKDVKAGVGSQK